MGTHTAAAAAPYITEIEDVREVSLLGAADAAWWREHLRREELHPFCGDGVAEVVVNTVDMRWMGVRFRELVLAVYVSRQPDGAGRDGLYLAHAFNTSRLLAFAERTLFQTPYEHGAIRVEHRAPAEVEVAGQSGVLLRAQMSAGSQPSRRAREGWELPVYLPSGPRRGARRVFFARIGGETTAYPFSPSADLLELRPAAHRAARWLAESRFAPREWALRDGSNHARSKTYPR